MLHPVDALAPGDRDLIERGPDLARLQDAIDQARSGEGSLVLVEGLAGIGKTRLIAECSERAGAAGVRVLTARGSELERDFTHASRGSCSSARCSAPRATIATACSRGPAAHAAETVVSDAMTPQHSAPGDSDFAAMHGLYWLAANLAARRPVMLAIDDGHWVDAASLRFANYLANRLSGLPLMVVLATRPGEPGAEAALLEELANSAAADPAAGRAQSRGAPRRSSAGAWRPLIRSPRHATTPVAAIRSFSTSC